MEEIENNGEMRGKNHNYSFSGLGWGKNKYTGNPNIYPTDIDLFIDFRQSMIVIAEGKDENGNFKQETGQANSFKSLEHLLDKTKCDVLFILFKHRDTSEFKDNRGFIVVNKCIPEIIRWNEEVVDMDKFKKEVPTKNIKDIIDFFGHESSLRFSKLKAPGLF